MEYIPNGTLFDHMKKGQGLPIPLVKNLGAQLVNFLEYIHAALEICHRDLKPGNIMIDDSLYLKIVSINNRKFWILNYLCRLILEMQKPSIIVKIMVHHSIQRNKELRTSKHLSAETRLLAHLFTSLLKCWNELSQVPLPICGHLA